MSSASVVMVIFTIILFICIVAMSFMNIAQSMKKVNDKLESNKFLSYTANKLFVESDNKTVKPWAAIGVAGVTLVCMLVLTITGATAKKEAFSAMLL